MKKQIGKARQHREQSQASPALEEYQKAFQTLNEAKGIVANQKRDFAILYDAIGSGLLALDREVDGIKALDRALVLDPNNIKAIIHRGIYLHGKGQDDMALRQFELAISQEPDNSSLVKQSL